MLLRFFIVMQKLIFQSQYPQIQCNLFLINLGSLSLLQYRLSIRELKLGRLSFAFVFSWFQVRPILLISAWRSFPWPASLHFPRGFHVRTCLEMFDYVFCSMCLIHPCILFPVSFSSGSCQVFSNIDPWMFLVGQWIKTAASKCLYSGKAGLYHPPCLCTKQQYRFQTGIKY